MVRFVKSLAPARGFMRLSLHNGQVSYSCAPSQGRSPSYCSSPSGNRALPNSKTFRAARGTKTAAAGTRNGDRAPLPVLAQGRLRCQSASPPVRTAAGLRPEHARELQGWGRCGPPRARHRSGVGCHTHPRARSGRHRHCGCQSLQPAGPQAHRQAPRHRHDGPLAAYAHRPGVRSIVSTPGSAFLPRIAAQAHCSSQARR